MDYNEIAEKLRILSEDILSGSAKVERFSFHSRPNYLEEFIDGAYRETGSEDEFLIGVKRDPYTRRKEEE